MNNFQKLSGILTKEQKTGTIILSFLLFAISVFEIFFLQSILILVSSISNNSENNFLIFLQQFDFYYFFDEPLKMIILLFFLFFLMKSLFNIFVIRYEANFLYKTKEKLTNIFFQKYISLPKLFHIKLSLANLTKKIILQVDDLTVALRSISILFLETWILILITIYLLTVNFYLSIYIFLMFSICTILILLFNKNKIEKIGKDQLSHSEKRIKIVNEILSSLKFFKNKKFKENNFKEFYFHNKKTNEISIAMAVKNGVIRPIFELIILAVIVTTLLYIFINDLLLIEFLPQFAVFLAASYRMLPSYARILTAYQLYKYHIQPVNEYYNDSIKLFTDSNLNQSKNKIEFFDNIQLKNISFEYGSEKDSNRNIVLQDVNIDFKKILKFVLLERVVQEKAPFLDIIMGLHKPTKGKIFIDGNEQSLVNIDWQDKIGFVPQNVFISSDSLKRNIAFGFEDNEIDNNKVNYYLELCNLKNFANSLENGIDTKLTDSGTNISGGQKQRIGIARALYSKPNILILDEPTNNLDEINEKDITEKLLKLDNITLILTTHKKEIISRFNKIYQIKNKKIIDFRI